MEKAIICFGIWMILGPSDHLVVFGNLGGTMGESDPLFWICLDDFGTEPF